MMIEKIEIKNFRSIEEIIIEPHKLTALVGANSAGKTNILKALNILLGEIYPTERAFSRDDFYKRETDRTISIRVWFSEPLNACRLTNKETNQKGMCVPTSLKFTHTENAQVSFGATSFIALDLAGNEYYGSSQVRDQISFIYIPSDRNLDKQMSVSQWTLLGKLLKKIDENFRKKDPNDSTNDLEKTFKEAMASPKEILESEFGENLNYKTFKDEFLSICNEYTRGLANTFDLDLEIYDPLFYYKTIQIIVNEDLGSFNINELGSGVQNLVLLSLFRTYAKLMKSKAILAIEEPEIYLYPQAQRQLYKNFRNLAYPEDGSAGTQIFYTTHNPNFVDPQNAFEVEMLYKDKIKGTTNFKKDLNFLNPDNAKKEFYRIYTNFNNERNELFFANKILFVEGHSDKILWTTLCKDKWSIEIDKEHISIIECGGKGGIVYFIGVCKLLGINNYFAVWDKDDDEEDLDDSRNILPTCLYDNKGLQIEGNLEKFLSSRFVKEKYPQFNFSKSKNKVKNAHVWATEVSVKEIPNEFDNIKTFCTENSSLPEIGFPVLPGIFNELPTIDMPDAYIGPEDIPF